LETLPGESAESTHLWKKELPQADIILEAERILYFASERAIVLRLLGGLGVWFSAPSAGKPEYAREYHDLDFMGYRKQASKIEKFFTELGYTPRELFNKLHGSMRLMFFDTNNDRRVDIFLDGFTMCHKFDFKDSLELCERTLQPSDLLITKLQIYEINRKDITDVIALILDTPVTDEISSKRRIDTTRIADLCSDDWGTYRTVTMNIEKIFVMLDELGIPKEDARIIREKLLIIRKKIEDVPKSFRWKMRAKVGERVRWYELPESSG
jgi:hypothetical protein